MTLFVCHFVPFYKSSLGIMRLFGCVSFLSIFLPFLVWSSIFALVTFFVNVMITILFEELLGSYQ